MVRHLLVVVTVTLDRGRFSLCSAGRPARSDSVPVQLLQPRWFSSRPVSGMGFRSDAHAGWVVVVRGRNDRGSRAGRRSEDSRKALARSSWQAQR